MFQFCVHHRTACKPPIQEREWKRLALEFAAADKVQAVKSSEQFLAKDNLSKGHPVSTRLAQQSYQQGFPPADE